MNARALLGRRDFRLLLIGTALSMLGDSALIIALAVWARELTGSYSAAGFTLFALVGPSLFAPFAGLVVDRTRRRTLLVVTNLATAVALLPLLAVHDRGQVWIIFAVGVAYGVSYLFIGSAMNGLLKEILPEELLGDANGLLQTIRESLRLAGPIAGAALFAALGGGAVAIADAATFVVATGFLVCLHVREGEPEPREHHFLAEATAGARHIAAEPVLRRTVLAVAVAFLVAGFAESIFFPVLDHLHEPATFAGPLLSTQGIGAIAGGLSAPWLIRRIGESALVGAGLALFGIGDLILAAPSLPVVLGGIVVAGIGVAWAVVGFTTLLQRRTPNRLMGRVSSAADLLVGTPQTLSIGVGAVLVAAVDFRVLLLVMAVVLVAAGGFLLVRPAGPALVGGDAPVSPALGDPDPAVPGTGAAAAPLPLLRGDAA